jgi:hypothetical protein
MRSSHDAGWYAGAILIALGLATAGSGITLLCRTLKTTDDVVVGNRVRNGGLQLSKAELDDTIERLTIEARPSVNADEGGALTFLHYASAEAAAARANRLAWIRELLAARASARQTLALEPMRADVSLALAEIEFLLRGPGKPVYAALKLSYITAPRELWIVERRIGLELMLVPTAAPEILSYVEDDVRSLGQPYRNTGFYRELARAAFVAGPPAIALVRRVLASVHEQPLQIFNQDLAQMEDEKARN